MAFDNFSTYTFDTVVQISHKSYCSGACSDEISVDILKKASNIPIYFCPSIKKEKQTQQLSALKKV